MSKKNYLLYTRFQTQADIIKIKAMTKQINFFHIQRVNFWTDKYKYADTL